MLVGGRLITIQVPTVVSGNVSVLAKINQAGISGKRESSLGTGGLFSASKANPEKEAAVEVGNQKDQVFVMMPIATDKPELEDILAAVKRSAKKYDIECVRVDEIEHTGKITDLILNQINSSRYLVCDISIERPNVYYELGYSHGRGKEVILIAREGSVIYFDIKDYNIIFYKNITELENRLSKRIEAIRARRKNTLSSPLKNLKFRQTPAATDTRMKNPSISKKTSA